MFYMGTGPEYQLERVPPKKMSTTDWTDSVAVGQVDQDADGLKKMTRQARIISAYQDAAKEMSRREGNPQEYGDEMRVVTRPNKYDEGIEPPCCSPCCPPCPDTVSQALRVNRDMVPFKFLYVLLRGGLACIAPYLAVYLAQRGFDPLQSGLINSIAAYFTAVLTPLLGYLADRYRCRKGLLLASLAAWLALTMSLNFVPSPDRAPCKDAYHRLLSTIGASEEDKLACEELVDKASADSHILHPLHVLNVLEPVVNFSAACPVVHHVHDVEHENNTARRKKRSDDFLHGLDEPDNLRKYKAATGVKRSWLYDSESLQRTFSFVFVLITLGEVMQAATLFLTDTATLHQLGPKNRDSYGWHRSFGSAGYALYTLGLAECLDVERDDVVLCGIVVPTTDYRIATVVFAGTLGTAVTLVVASSYFKLKYAYTTPFGDYRLKDMTPIVFSWHYGSIVITALFLAVLNGCADSFLHHHLAILGATQFLFSIVLAVQGGSELLTASQASYLIKRYGHVNLLYAGLAAYFLRFVWCAWIVNPWWIIPGEILKGMSIALTWNIFTSYMCEAVPAENLATLQGFITGLYHGLGRGVGLMLGGLLVQSVGTFMTFAACAIACVFYGIGFLVIQQCSEQPYATAYIHYSPVTGLDYDDHDDDDTDEI